MNVTFYNRPEMKGVFSEETVFGIIRDELPKGITINDFYCSEYLKRGYSLLEAPAHQGDVNHITGDVFHLALGLSGNKTIITVHDVGRYERALRGIKKNIWKYGMYEWPFKKSRFITAVSQFTKTRLLKHVSVSPEKIKVIHNPAPPDFFFQPKNFNQKNPWILQIGSGEQKNLHRLIEALEGINCRLLLIRRRDTGIEKQLKKKNIEYKWLENISRKKVYDCYKKCDIVFFASEYEGFGLPILEANAVGRPVITGDVASMPEVAGDSAYLVNPFDVNEIKKALIEIKDSTRLRDDLIRKGRENLKRFAPGKIAHQYLDLYKKAAGKNGNS